MSLPLLRKTPALERERLDWSIGSDGGDEWMGVNFG